MAHNARQNIDFKLIFLEGLERMEGIEPSYSAWEADVLPLNYTRNLAKDA